LLSVWQRSRSFGGGGKVVDCANSLRLEHSDKADVLTETKKRGDSMRGILLWLLGVPIFVIILLYIFNVL
jgi:hypothetical protein